MDTGASDDKGDVVASIGDIKAGLAGGRNEAQKALAQLAAVQAQVDKAIGILHALVAGTSQPAVTGAIAKLNAAKQKFNEGATSIQSAIADTDRYNSVL